MDFKKKYLEIYEYIKPYEQLISEEVLHFYPNSLEVYPKPWIESLQKLDTEDLWKFDGREEVESLKDVDVYQFFEKLDQITKVEKVEFHNPKSYESWAFYNVKDKKKHEIERIANFVESKKDNNLKIVDIGGGQGHMARVLAHYHGLDCTSLDQDQNLQKQGKVRLKKYPTPENSKDVNFVHHKFGSAEDKNILSNVIDENTMTLGLHTCGPLALKQFENSIHFNSKSFLNFGCCYAKLSEAETHLSEFAKNHSFKMSPFSLTLASRAHTQTSLEEFLLKKRVKEFRYTAHRLLFHELGKTEFISLGDARPKVYWGKFSDYFLDKLNNAQINHSFDSQYLDDFIDTPENKEIIEELFIANSIRWRFGRAVELLILLDRAIFLEDLGQSVEIKSFFDEELSPRNIGIYSSK